jgi:hypothetical protein
MPSQIAYVNTAIKSELTLLERSLRVLQVVAGTWTLLGAAVNFFTLDSPNVKWHILGIGCLLIAAAMYSLLLPLYYITRAHRTHPDA